MPQSNPVQEQFSDQLSDGLDQAQIGLADSTATNIDTSSQLEQTKAPSETVVSSGQSEVDQTQQSDNEPVHLGLIDHGDDKEPLDFDKAWARAHEEKHIRDEASNNRRHADEIVADPASNFDGRAEKIADSLRRTATENDHMADEVGDWAEIVYDHPISEAYKRSHEGIDFDGHSLMLMDMLAEKDLRTVRELEEHLEKAPNLVGIIGLPSKLAGLVKEYAPTTGNDFDPEHVLTDAYGVEPSKYKPDRTDSRYKPNEEGIAKWQEWKTLLENPDATLRQFRELYTEAFRRAYIYPMRSYANTVKSVLEDVRSGRASQ